MRSQRLSGRVLSTNAFANPSRLPYKFGKEGANGSEGHIANYSEDHSEKVLPAASFATSRHFIMLVTATVNWTGVVGDDQTESDFFGVPTDDRNRRGRRFRSQYSPTT